MRHHQFLQGLLIAGAGVSALASIGVWLGLGVAAFYLAAAPTAPLVVWLLSTNRVE
jgi:hypothetical protein